MTSGRGALTALHLFLVWAMTATAVPALGFGLVAAAWGGGAGATVPVLALGAPLMVGLLALAGLPVKDVVPLCGSVPRRLGWAVLVFVLGTLGVLSGLAAYGGDVDLGSAGTRIVLTGVPYTVAAAFFVPGRWVRSGALVVLAAGVVYGGSSVRRSRGNVSTRRRSRGTGRSPSCCTWAPRRRACTCPVRSSAPPPSSSTTAPCGRGTSRGTRASSCARRTRRNPDAPSPWTSPSPARWTRTGRW